MSTLAPFGFQAGQSRRSVNEYYVPASDTSAYAVGDPVKTNGNVFVGRLPDSRQSNGMLHVGKASPGNAVRGVVVGVVAGPGDNSAQSVPAVKQRAYTLLINDNPQALWDVQANNTATLSVMGGMYASYTVGGPLGSVSSTVVDASSIGVTVNDLLIAEVLTNPGANSLLRVAFVQHEMAAAGGSPQIGAQIQSLVSGARIQRDTARRGFPLLANITSGSGHTLTWQSGTVGGVEYIERDGMRGIRLTTAAGLYVELNVPAFSRLIPKGQVSALYYIPDDPGNAAVSVVSMYVGSAGYAAAYNRPVNHYGSNSHANAHTGYYTLAPDPLTSPADTARVEWQVNAGAPDWSSTTMAAAKMRITPTAGQSAVVEVFGIWAGGTQQVPKCVFVADDGYDSIRDVGLPIFERFGHRLSMAIIADSVGLSGYMGTSDLQDAEARGHECVVHGPNTTALNLSEFTTQAEIEADLATGQEQLRGAGLGQENNGDLIYVYPQGIYQHARDDHRIRDALIARGFIAARLATTTQSSLEMAHAGRLPLHISIIGHTWVSDVTEAANIARIIVKIQEAAAQGRSVVIMLHKITAGAATQALEMAAANLTMICSALDDLEAAGTMQNATLGELVQEMRAHVGAV